MMSSSNRFSDGMMSSSNRFNDGGRFSDGMMTSSNRFDEDEMFHSRMMKSGLHHMDISEQRLNERFMGGNMGRFSAGHNSSSSMNLQDEMNNFSGGMMQGRGMMGMDSSGFGNSNDLNRNLGGRGMMGMDSSGFRNSKDPWKE